MVEDGYGRNSIFDRPQAGHPEAWISLSTLAPNYLLQGPKKKINCINYAAVQNGYVIAGRKVDRYKCVDV